MKISHKHCESTLAAMTRLVVKSRAEIQKALDDLACKITEEQIAGTPFCIFNFITSETDGSDVTLGIPLEDEIESDQFTIETLPEMDVLSTVHQGEVEGLRDTVGGLYAYADQYALISDEFYREVYLDFDQDGDQRIEVQFVIHDWNGKLAAGLDRVMGADVCQYILQGSGTLEVETDAQERFDWVKGMMTRLVGTASQGERYEILSGCAHVFPQRQIDKLTRVFSDARRETGDPLKAVDAVIEFMERDPGWVEGGRREGYTIYAVKPPSDKKAYSEAKTDLERRQAYCFCPVLNRRIDQGMPPDYCYCGSGWFRQQWEGAVGKPVKIDIVRSVLRGDDACEFAIHL